MTNKELTTEICRMIRGIALNYPTGMDEIRRCVEAHSPKAQTVTESTPPVVAAQTVTLPGDQPVKRGPGRPRKNPV